MESVKDFEMSVGCGPQKLNLKKRKGEVEKEKLGRRNKFLKMYRNKIFGMKRSYFLFCRPNTRIHTSYTSSCLYSAISTLSEITWI